MPGTGLSSLLERLIPQAGADGGRPRVLVAYASGVLATAISRRLAMCADVDLAHVRGIENGIASYDAVVICPYLTDDEARRVHAAISAAEGRPVVVDVRESIGCVDADVDWGDRRRADAVRPVVEALTA